MMFGALEALSREAVKIYFEGAERCRNELAWQDWGEDVFLSHCLDLLGVGNIGDYNIMGMTAATGRGAPMAPAPPSTPSRTPVPGRPAGTRRRADRRPARAGRTGPGTG